MGIIWNKLCSSQNQELTLEADCESRLRFHSTGLKSDSDVLLTDRPVRPPFVCLALLARILTLIKTSLSLLKSSENLSSHLKDLHPLAPTLRQSPFRRKCFEVDNNALLMRRPPLLCFGLLVRKLLTQDRSGLMHAQWSGRTPLYFQEFDVIGSILKTQTFLGRYLSIIQSSHHKRTSRQADSICSNHQVSNKTDWLHFSRTSLTSWEPKLVAAVISAPVPTLA